VVLSLLIPNCRCVAVRNPYGLLLCLRYAKLSCCYWSTSPHLEDADSGFSNQIESMEVVGIPHRQKNRRFGMTRCRDHSAT